MFPKKTNYLLEVRFRIKKFQLLSDFKKKFLQRVSFQINFFTTRQILKPNFHNMSDFKSKISQRVRFCFKKKLFKNQILHKIVPSKNNVLTEFTPQNGRILPFLCIFKKHDSDGKNIYKKQVLN